MDFDLTDEQRLIKETAREFADKEIVVQSRENAREHRFDMEMVRKVADQGYLGAIVPERYGGAGLDYLSYGLVVEEIGRADSSIRTVISVQTSLVCSGILKFGTEEQKRTYLPKLCSGEWLGCFGLTEPDTGSDAASQKTRARKTEGGWVLNGSKMWISMANYAKVALIFAQTDPELGYKGIACFMVDTEHPGYSAQPIEHKMGLHASDTGSISLEDVEVTDEQMLGNVGDGFKVALSNLESGRYSVACGAVGICQGCVEESVKYAKEREQFGKPIASFQLVQAMIAEMALKTEASRMLAWRAGFLKDRGRPNSLETSIAKLHATEASLECANLAIQVHGGAGYVDDHPVERYFRDARVTTIYEGTSQIQQMLIGRALTGVNALVPA
ncbi:MAG TPA: acyl-CoA dehydrogenase family protein [Solirubrobacteraceae bacterium]|nr:acyl-CoA dehydrogenase family protein [Solirubrobacteraceae bacterium]